ncbi:MAG: N-6 DNA methylase, partial [Planctomyces sp.]
MQWIAPSEKDAASTSLEKRLWDSADQFRANSGRKAQKYSGPILGLIFLRFAKVRFAAQRAKREFDAFGHIYEYFLGEFVMSEGQGGGEFYTPASIVQL